MMRTHDIRPLHARDRQAGAALIIALAFLVLLTIIGVSALNMSTLASLITRNDQLRQMAFLAAENALRAGEAWTRTQAYVPITTNTIWDKVTNAAADRAGVFRYGVDSTYYDTTTYPEPYQGPVLDINQLDWDDDDSQAAGGGRYIVEYLNTIKVNGIPTHFYRIVGRATGAATVVLESTYGVEGAE